MNISRFQSNLDFIKSLYFHEKWKDKRCRNEILEALEEANEKIEKAFGISMHYLHRHKPSIEAVGKVVKKFPSTLSCRNDIGSIPIQFAAASRCVDYVPILAREGFKYKVGGEDARGGLLMVDPRENYGWNTLQWLVRVGDETDDAKRVDVLRELRSLGLLKKKDVQEQELLNCSHKSKRRFEYLVDWDPDALIETMTRVENRNAPLIHCMLSAPEETLLLMLKSGFQYHPRIGGLLFVKDDEGNTAFDALCNGKGTANIMSLLLQILSPKRNYPILHQIFVKAPQHINLFMKKFPWAYYLKDHNGRTLHQAVLTAGPNVMNANDILLATLTDNQIQTKDPITTLYPFAAMAVGEHADLENTFYLLRRLPSVMDRDSRQ